MKLVLATHNDGKTVEMQHALSHLPVKVLTLKNFPQIEDIPETGASLLENAFIKAETVFKITGIPSLADDTGLEIKALGGEPGIFSARYAGEKASYEDNCNKVLAKLAQSGSSERSARFRTVIAFVSNNEKLHCEGSVEGEIIEDKIGTYGFGYDPIFFYPKLKKTFAELGKVEKNNVSHRGKALRNFCKIFEKRINHERY